MLRHPYICIWGMQATGNSLSGQPFIEQIYDFKPVTLPQKQSVQLVEKYVDSKGINRVKGSRFLKGSQAYTRQFLRLFDWLYILWCYGIYIWAAYQMDQQFEKVLFWTFFESISRNFYGCGKLLYKRNQRTRMQCT